MAGEKRTIDRIINFFNENSFEHLIREAKSEYSSRDKDKDPMYGGAVCDEVTKEEFKSIPSEKLHMEEIEELNNDFNIFFIALDSFLTSIRNILLREDSCLSDQDKVAVIKFFNECMYNKEICYIPALLRNIYIDARNMEKLAKLNIGEKKDSAYVLAVKHGLLEEKDGTYTPIFEEGKKGLKNVLRRWYELSEGNEIPMPTYDDISNKLRKEEGGKYKKNYIRNCLQEFRYEKNKK